MMFNASYLIVVVATLAIGLGAQAMIRHAKKKWSRVAIATGMSGAQAARRMLDEHGLAHVAVVAVPGDLTDHFDPRSNTVALSQETFEQRSVAACAIACHECSHAVQHAHNYAPAKVRGAIVPVVNAASNLWVVVLIAGIFLNLLGLVYLAIGLYLAVIAFQLVTLPVEFNASRRAMEYINARGFLPPDQAAGAKSVLRSAAMTYVAAALASLLYLVWALGFARR